MKRKRTRYRLAALLLTALFVLLIGYGYYSYSAYGTRWFASTKNPRLRKVKTDVTAGTVYDRDGVILAQTVNGKRTYADSAPVRRAMVHLLGDRAGNVSNGMDTFLSSYLFGFKTTLFERIGQLAGGQPQRGDDVVLSVDAALSVKAAQAFNAGCPGKTGAVIVMNYRTGEVLVLESFPEYDPDNIPVDAKKDPNDPFWNRATRTLLAPGSTFKIVTTAAALKTIPDVTGRQFECNGHLSVMNRLITDAGNAAHGTVTLQEAFVKSCNNIFAQLALEIGDDVLRKSAERFGFNDNFLFQDLVVENSVYPTGKRDDVEVAWTGAGQSTLLATPMHMCMIASAIANDGVMMEPALLLSATAATGGSHYDFTPRVYRTALSAEEAEMISGLMRQVVTDGTGRSAGVPGYSVCGKTGSAEASLNGNSVTNAWFVGFVEDESMPYAVCVLVEDGGSGSTAAAPVAGTVLSAAVELTKEAGNGTK